MRGRVRQRQDVWYATTTTEQDGISSVTKYSIPIKKRQSISSTSGTPMEISAGIVPTYDRYITNFEKSFNPKEGTMLWVDVVPELDENGELKMEEDGITPVTPPDYRLEKKLATLRGNVDRYGIKKVGGND